MLHLKRVQYFTDHLKCSISGRTISWGDYYYEDDEDGVIISGIEMARIKKEKRENAFYERNQHRLNALEDYRDYKEAVKDYERQFLEQDVRGRKIFGEGV